MDTKIQTLIDKALEINMKLIENGQEIITTCLIPKDDQLIGIAMPFENTQHKNMFKVTLKRFLVESGTKIYVLISDIKMTINDKNNDKDKMFNSETTQVKDCILIVVYTPQEKKMVAYPYKDKKFDMKNKIVFDGRNEIEDDFDLWGKSIDTQNKISNEYSKFRSDNPNLYGDLS